MAKTTKKEARLSTVKAFVIKNKAHLFPLTLLVILLTLTCLRVSGTSIGVYNQYFNGVAVKDPALIYGQPQEIRSDEWLVTTQLTIAQSVNGYKPLNDNYAEPKDLGLLVDVPSYDWSTIFKPQNYLFLIIPLEFAFAFKWWFLLFVLCAASYYFCLRLLRGNILESILGSIVVTFSPFIFWWYQTTTIAPLAYSFLILLIAMSIVDRKPWKLFKKRIATKPLLVLKASILGYLIAGFALVLYIPFLIPLVLVVTSFIVGYLLNSLKSLNKKALLSIFLPFIGGGVIGLAICGAYVITRYDEVQTITSTAYPGKREASPGAFNVNQLLVTYLQPQLQRHGKGTQYISNQSESANFIVLPIFFLIPSIGVLLWLYIKKRRIEWVLVGLIFISLIFSLHLFAPQTEIISKIFFLNLVPYSRTFIGLGLLGFLLAIYTVVVIKREKIATKKFVILASLYSAIYLLVTILAGIAVSINYPGFISSKKLIILLAIIPATGLWLLLIGRLRLGLLILSLFSLGSVFAIHPLYVGLGPLYKSDLTNKIYNLSTEKSVWASAEDIYIENVPQLSNRKSVTGVNPYPSIEFWKQLSDDESDYNRYAHIFVTNNNSDDLILLHPDMFAASISCVRPLNKKIDYIVSTSIIEGSCHTLIDTITYPARTFYFYKTTY